MNPVIRELLGSAAFIYHYVHDEKYREYIYLMRCCASMPRYTETVIKFRGIDFYIPDAASFWSSYQDIIYKGIYEFSCSDVESPIILDFGANIGLSVFFFSQKYPKAQIYAYEADPYIFNFLEKNVVQFNHHGRIRLFNQAVCDHDDVLEFVSEGADGGHIGTAKGGERVLADVSVKAVDASVIFHEFDVIDMLKMDIEGSERYVLPAIKEQLYKVRNIFVEYHSEASKKQCLSELIQIMEQDGFRIFLHPVFCANRPLTEFKINAGFDMQMNIFGRREKMR